MSRKKIFFLLLLIVAAAAFIRVVSILNWDSYLFDEQISAAISQKPVAEMWSYLKWEMHPPLHFYYLHYWLSIFGSSEIAGRASSLVLGLAAIVAVYFLGKRIFNSPIACLYASFFVAISSFQSFYSIWTRMYMLFFLLSILNFYFFYRAVKENKAWLWWLTWLTMLLAIYSHLTTLAIPVIQVIFLIYLKYKKQISPQIIRRYAVVLGANILLFLPWVYNFLTIRLQVFSSRAWYFWAEPYDLFFINVPIRFMIAGNTEPIAETVAMAVFIILLISALTIWQKKETGKWEITARLSDGQVYSLLIAFLPLLAVHALQLNALRLYMLPAIGVYLLFAYGADRLQLGKYKKWLAVIIFVIVLAPLSEILKLPEIGWQRITAFIEQHEQPGDKIVTAVYNQLMTIDFYYHGSLESDSVLNDKLRTDDRLLTILQTNFFPPTFEEYDNQLGRLTDGHNRIFFMFSKNLFGRIQDYPIQWLFEHGWQIQDKITIGGFTEPEVWLMYKGNR